MSVGFSRTISDHVLTTSFAGKVLTIPVYEPPIQDVPLQKVGSIIQLRNTNDVYRATFSGWKEFTNDPTIFQLLSEGGGAIDLVAASPGPNLEIVSVGNGSGVSLTPASSDIAIGNSGVLSVTSSTSPGTSLITGDTTASVVKVRTLLGVSGITSANVGNDQNNLSINPFSPDIVTSITTATPIIPLSLEFLADSTNPDITMKSMADSTYCEVADGGTYIQLNVTFPDPPGDTMLTSLGGQSLVNTGIGPGLIMKGLTAGPNVTLTDNGTDIEIDANFGPITPNIDSVIAGAGITISPPSGTGNVTINATIFNGVGFFAQLNTDVVIQANSDIKGAGIWSLQWNNGGLFDNGVANITSNGTYFVSWATCLLDTPVTTSLCINGLIWGSQNGTDSDGQGVNSGCASVQLQVGDVVSLRNDATQTVYYRVRGDTPISGATYFSIIKIADITEVNNTQQPGTYKELNADITSIANLPIVSPSPAEWTSQWDNPGYTWGDGIFTILTQGAYFVSWATCIQDTDITTSLCINNYTIQSQNGTDSDGQGVNYGSGIFYLAVGDTVNMINDANQVVYYRTRGDFLNMTGATYLSLVRMATWL